MSLKAMRGFTIVELLIVIVVIAVLAAVTAVAYTNMQGRARDSQRLTDMKTIMKALEVYKTHNGSYPDEVGTVNASGWEITSDGAAATNFLSALVSANGISKVPLDPRNAASNTGAGSLNPSRSAGNFVYYYHRYPAGANGCDVNRGDSMCWASPGWTRSHRAETMLRTPASSAAASTGRPPAPGRPAPTRMVKRQFLDIAIAKSQLIHYN